ncbi:MAG: hypothetical protein ACK501_14285 [Planctomycetota bacterium]
MRTNARWWITWPALAVLAGCSGVAAVPSRGLQRGAPPPLAAAPAPVATAATPAAREVVSAPQPATPVATAAPVAEAPQPGAANPPAANPAGAGEAELREQLALAADPVPAAQELVVRLGAGERFDEALAVVAAARQRSDSPLLSVLQASVLRDLGQRHAALAELLQLRGKVGAAAFAPALQIEVAELQWLEGQKAEASATLTSLRSAVGDSAPAAVLAKLERLANEIGAAAAPRTIAVRDLLGNLRGAPTATARLDALDRLMRVDADAEVQRRAILVAAGDEASSVRARAVQLAAPAEADREEFCRVALADAAPLVRRFAIARTVELLGGAGTRVLVERLAVETDESLFVALDAALCRVVPGNEPHPLASGDAGQRREVVGKWQRVLEGR